MAQLQRQSRCLRGVAANHPAPGDLSSDVTTEGQPPEIAFDPKYLADAIEIGPTLRLVDKLNPGMATSPSSNFCLLMSLRFTEETTKEETTSETPAPAIAA